MSTDLARLASLYGPHGSVYFAAVISTAFYGVTCMQTFFYYVHYENDPLRIKILVAILCALNTIHEALTVSGAYKYIMACLANPSTLLVGIPELILQYISTALVVVPTQGFFVYRIYIFSGKNIVAPVVWAVLSLVQFVCSIIYIGKALYSANIGGSYVTIGTISLCVGAGIDILIAIFMTFLLVRERRATGFASTAHLLQRLIMFAVNTGIWTATFALLSSILVYLFPTNTLYTVFTVPLCSIYCNAILANLNARAYFRDVATTYRVDMGILGTSPSAPVSDSTKGNK